MLLGQEVSANLISPNVTKERSTAELWTGKEITLEPFPPGMPPWISMTEDLEENPQENREKTPKKPD